MGKSLYSQPQPLSSQPPIDVPQGHISRLASLCREDARPVSVSVCMICYNHGKYLDEAIRGVLMQKADFPVNVVIIDNASTDDSAEIIMRYASVNPNITPIIQKKNLNQAGKDTTLFNLHKAVKDMMHYVLPYLTGKYVAYCEGDDFWIDPDKLRLQAQYLESNPDCPGVYSNTLPVNKFSEYDESTRLECYAKTGEGDYPREKLLMGVRHQFASLMMRNFYTFMTQDELDFFSGVKSNGDEKILAMLLMLGRVHYFAEELAAHRRVVDGGGSWSTAIARTSRYNKYRMGFIRTLEIVRMIEYFKGEEYRYKYFFVLRSQAESLMIYNRN
ncbi:MAG: glycosyltransferase family 2 protein, partial [Synergistaceae bacterium]|nr:glycosyltransferase family 2 protein [Synergistaceae bacterium]